MQSVLLLLLLITSVGRIPVAKVIEQSAFLTCHTPVANFMQGTGKKTMRKNNFGRLGIGRGKIFRLMLAFDQNRIAMAKPPFEPNHQPLHLQCLAVTLTLALALPLHYIRMLIYMQLHLHLHSHVPIHVH